MQKLLQSGVGTHDPLEKRDLGVNAAQVMGPHRPHGHRSGREADVREVRLYDGRHMAATLLLTEGVHPRVVMEVVSHAQMRTTTDTYSRVMPALGRDAADRMGNALWN